jgi:hypothetical protein
MKSTILLLVLAATYLALTGCVAMQEGPGFTGSAQFGSNHWYLCHKNEENAKGEAESIAQVCNRELILIGRASAFREFEGVDVSEFYNDYKEFAVMIGSDSFPEVSYEKFNAEFAGWTRLKVFSIPGIFGSYEDVLVPQRLRGKIDFASSAETILYQGTGDLVAAKTNADGFFVAYKVLCEEDVNFQSCVKNHPTGVFDATTGVQVTRSMKPAEGGNTLPELFLRD